MKIQLNAASIKQVQDLTNAVARVNAEITIYLRARKMRADVEDGVVPEPKELPLRYANITTHHLAGASARSGETQEERDALFDIAEILTRTHRDRLVAQLDQMGVVLTDLPDFGPAPAWPQLSV